ncbi:MAG: FkbM family methyltransferase [Methylobacter sp.]|nr:FkbM family methyltransferase [Methylobacter sp.]
MRIFKRICKALWLIRKAFFSSCIKLHYSQFGEDIVLKELLKKEKIKKYQGFFVDVGCYHPKKLSNTYMLYKAGWSGINIDMEADKISLFNMVRPRDWNVLSPISDKQEQVNVYRFGKFGVGSTINHKFAIDTGDTIYDTTELVSKTLDQIIEESPYRGKQIDVLSIDVEGMDYKVLSSLNLEAYQPKIIIIESHYRSIEEILNTDIYHLLKAQGYILRSWIFYSLIFILPNSDILKEREII